jgi:hypothetical protein
MKPLINYNSILFRVHFKCKWAFLFAIVSGCLFSSCDKDNLEIKKDFPFEVSVMPFPKEISSGNTIEIRLAIQRTDKYSGTQYFIRYFQYDGLGLLRYYHQHAYLPNDLYPLPAEQFRLCYTSQSTVTQSFTIWISDNLGNEKQLSFQLNSTD